MLDRNGSEAPTCHVHRRIGSVFAVALLTVAMICSGNRAAAQNPDLNGCVVKPLPETVPVGARTIDEFGVLANSGRDEDATIARALGALKPGDWLVFPPGRYIHSRSIRITTPGVTLWGFGAELYGRNPSDHSLAIRANDVRVLGFKLSARADKRMDAAEQSRISIYRERRPTRIVGVLIQQNTITPSEGEENFGSAGAAGILVDGAENFSIIGNTVRGTFADGIHITGSSRHGRVINNAVEQTGDDMIAVVSDLGPNWRESAQNPAYREQLLARAFHVSNILISGNSVQDSGWGRGIAVIGGSGVTIRANRIDRVAWGAGIIIAQEGGYNTVGPNNVRVEANHISQIQTTRATRMQGITGVTLAAIASGKTSNHGAIEMHAIQNRESDLEDGDVRGLLALNRILVTDNEISNVAGDGIRLGIDTPSKLIKGVSIQGNRLSKVGGRPFRHWGPYLGALACAGNSYDGQAVPGDCDSDATVEIPGALIDCALLP